MLNSLYATFPHSSDPHPISHHFPRTFRLSHPVLHAIAKYYTVKLGKMSADDLSSSRLRLNFI